MAGSASTVPPVEMFPQQHHLKKMAVITWCYTGDPNKAEEVFKPIRGVAKAAIDYVGPIPLPALNSLFDWVYPPGLQWYWNSDIFTNLSDKVIDLDVDFCAQLPSMHSTMHLYPINGAAHRVGKEDTAWFYRDGTFIQVIVGVDPDPANNPRNIQWAKDFWQAVHPYSSGGACSAHDDGSRVDRVKTVYSGNYARLAQLRRYDPDNLFHVTRNIKPAR
jgi:FAD/FMN-containing dehydrogenase